MTLKILSYNIHKGFNKWGSSFILPQIREAIRSTDADLVFLQEVVGANAKHAKNVELWPEESQFEFLADHIWPHFSYGKNAVYTESNHGNAILSRYPIQSWSNVDLSNNRWEQRGLLHCEINVIPAHRIVHALNVHLDLLHFGRVKQVQQILNYAREYCDDRPLVLAGDFNDWTCQLTRPLSTEMGIKESFVELYGRHAITFPSQKPLLSLDRVYSRDLLPLNAVVLTGHPWDYLSDHYPLYVELKLDEDTESIID